MANKDDFFKNMVSNDLGKYGQDNPCPMSLTIVEGKLWRHYELGAIYGFVVYNRFETYNGSETEWWGIASIQEDDEYWFVSDCSMNMAAFWIEAVNKTWQRMVKWTKEHLREGWMPGANLSNPNEYKRLVIKPIVPEIVDWASNEEPDNAVLGTKFSIINDAE